MPVEREIYTQFSENLISSDRQEGMFDKGKLVLHATYNLSVSTSSFAM